MSIAELVPTAPVAATAGLTVEIWSDVVCPWCAIGKRRWETALSRFAHRDRVEVIWRSFQLDPNSPRLLPISVDEMLAKKYGRTLDEAAAMSRRVTEVAATEGLKFRFDQAKSGNTFDAHRLIHLAATHGLQAAATERLMRAYFSEGEPIGDPDRLVALIAEIGIDPDEARSVLASGRYTTEVRDDLRRAAAFGVTGVPFFVIDEKYGISGAQPVEALLDALGQAWADSHPLTMLANADGGSCDDSDCDLPWHTAP